ncbi:MAG: EF-hand domain-containing protein [Myxococcaceae bacterium]|nr:EF-hand domain-containing protein [Myxococcaceae bacterium]
MAAKKQRKKPAPAKPAKKARVSGRSVSKKPAAAKAAVAPAPTKRKGTPRNPPMHARVWHPELEDEVEQDEVFEIFKVYDTDGSGSIDRAEFSRLLEALGQTPGEEELAIALDVVDANHSGRISWDEFKAWWANR